jgi:pimeloyl-ACP methyl ester carboxylesterase
VVHGKSKCRSCEFDDRFMEFAARLHAGGFNLLLVDLRAHGQSEGKRFTLGDHERRDVLGAVDWLGGRGFESIGIVGVSLGAVSSVGAASDPESGHLVKALVIDSSFADLSELLRVRFTKESGLPGIFFPGSLFMARVLVGTDPYAVKPVQDLPRVGAPVMVIYGGQDDIVPIDQLQAMAAVRPDAETWFVADAAHARIYNAQPEQYVSRVTRFLDEVLP